MTRQGFIPPVTGRTAHSTRRSYEHDYEQKNVLVFIFYTLFDDTNPIGIAIFLSSGHIHNG